jgi:hypothetical protein
MAGALHCLNFKHYPPRQSGCGLAQLYKDLSTPLGGEFGGNCKSAEADVTLFAESDCKADTIDLHHRPSLKERLALETLALACHCPAFAPAHDTCIGSAH